MSTSKEIENIDFSDSEFLLSKMPLYTNIKITSKNIEQATDFLVSRNYTFHAYCVECKKDSIFKNKYIGYSHNPQFVMGSTNKFHLYPTYITFVSCCALKEQHLLYTQFIFKAGLLVKSGQYPSVADLSYPHLSKYKKVLTDDELFEFRRGVGLISYDVGIGAFIYLRRIVENMIYKAMELYLTSEKIIESENEFRAEFNSLKILEKMKKVKKYLPELLFENKVVYQILSKGIHQLTEKECIDNFTLVKETIELILNKELYLKEEKERQDIITNELNKLKTELDKK